MKSINEIKKYLENNEYIKNPAFVTKIVDTVTEAHQQSWAEELDNLTIYTNCDEKYFVVIIGSRYETFYFVNSLENPEYIRKLDIGNQTLKLMYDVSMCNKIQANIL